MTLIEIEPHGLARRAVARRAGARRASPASQPGGPARREKKPCPEPPGICAYAVF